MRQLKSIETIKRLEDQRLEIAAQHLAQFAAQRDEVAAEIDRLEEDLLAQLAHSSIELAPYLSPYLRAARKRIDQLQAQKAQFAEQVAAQEVALSAIFRKLRVYELAENRHLEQRKKSADAARAARALEDMLRRAAQ